jgi:hypothetical protein
MKCQTTCKELIQSYLQHVITLCALPPLPAAIKNAPGSFSLTISL